MVHTNVAPSLLFETNVQAKMERKEGLLRLKCVFILVIMA
jgi:hypothetical protein